MQQQDNAATSFKPLKQEDAVIARQEKKNEKPLQCFSGSRRWHGISFLDYTQQSGDNIG